MRAFGVIGCGFALAAAVAPAAAQPATSQPAAPPMLHSSAVLLIRLAVAEVRCTGSHQKMVARYRPVVLQDFRYTPRAIGQAMTKQYREAYGENWRHALNADMTAARTSFEQDPDQAGFCKHSAIRAREVAGRFENSAGRFRDPAKVENDMVRLLDRIR